MASWEASQTALVLNWLSSPYKTLQVFMLCSRWCSLYTIWTGQILGSDHSFGVLVSGYSMDDEYLHLTHTRLSGAASYLSIRSTQLTPNSQIHLWFQPRTLQSRESERMSNLQLFFDQILLWSQLRIVAVQQNLIVTHSYLLSYFLPRAIGWIHGSVTLSALACISWVTMYTADLLKHRDEWENWWDDMYVSWARCPCYCCPFHRYRAEW